MMQVKEKDVEENLPGDIIKQLNLPGRFKALHQIHFPQSEQEYQEAVKRIKFEELFMAQVRMNLLRSQRHRYSKGVVFEKVGNFFNDCFKNHLPFELTGAQKE